jgi:hypothetical protein
VSLWQDVRYAARLLVKDKWFTAVAAVALALGIGVNTTVFTLVNVVLLRGLPFAEPARIIALGMTNPKGRQTGVSRLDFLDWRDASHSFSHLAMLQGAPMNVSEQGRPAEQYNGTYGSSSLFELIGQRPQLGRDFPRRRRHIRRGPGRDSQRQHVEEPVRRRSRGARPIAQDQRSHLYHHRRHGAGDEVPL